MSNRLPVLAKEVKDAARVMRSAERTAADAAFVVGFALIEAKELVQHGEWLPFLKQAGIPERKAQRCMTLARSNLKSDTVTDLGGITGALEFLRVRQHAVDQMGRAGVAFDAGDNIEGMVSLETSILLMERMVSMFARHNAA